MDDGCAKQRVRLSQRVDGELALRERPLALAHLARCADCREFDSELKGFTAALRRGSVRVPRFSLARMRAVAAVAVVLLAGVIGLNSLRSNGGSADVGALSPVQGLPVYVEGFPLQLGKAEAG